MKHKDSPEQWSMAHTGPLQLEQVFKLDFIVSDHPKRQEIYQCKTESD